MIVTLRAGQDWAETDELKAPSIAASKPEARIDLRVVKGMNFRIFLAFGTAGRSMPPFAGHRG
jgi:hypothetical protein